MERAIRTILCFMFFVSCTNDSNEGGASTEDSTEVADENLLKINERPTVFCGNLKGRPSEHLLEKVTVDWMYMDDSLKYICRPLNFILPWMKSDLKLLPEMITPEVARLSPLASLEAIETGTGKLNDTTYSYFIRMKRQACNCIVIRFYQGNPLRKGFQGYVISEQIICNADDVTLKVNSFNH